MQKCNLVSRNTHQNTAHQQNYIMLIKVLFDI